MMSGRELSGHAIKSFSPEKLKYDRLVPFEVGDHGVGITKNAKGKIEIWQINLTGEGKDE